MSNKRVDVGSVSKPTDERVTKFLEGDSAEEPVKKKVSKRASKKASKKTSTRKSEQHAVAPLTNEAAEAPQVMRTALNVRIPVDDHKELKKLCLESQMTLNAAVEIAVRDVIERLKKGLELKDE